MTPVMRTGRRLANRFGSLIRRRRTWRDALREDRRATEQALRERQRLISGAIDAATGYAIIATDLGGMITLVNPGAERMLGYLAEELIGEHTLEVIHDPRELAERAEQLGIAPGFEVVVRGARAGLLETREWTYVRRDRTTVPVELTVTPVLDERRQLQGFIGVAADLSERRRADAARMRAEQDLSEAETRLRQLLAAAPDAMITVDRRGIIRSANRQSERLLGYAGEELLGRSIDVLVPLASRAGHAAHRAAYAADPTTRPMGVERELTARHRDGHEVAVSITLSSIETDEGPLVTAAIRDVTERRREQEQLRAAEALFRETIDHAPIGIALVSTEGRWLRVNRALCDMTGYAEGELLATSFQEITHPDDHEADAQLVRRLLAGEIRSYELEKRYVRSDGSTIWILLSVSLLRDGRGDPVHFISQMQDISERKRYESELRMLADHDPLTGVANRRSLSAAIDAQLAYQARYGTSLAFLMIDIDQFKHINDTLGHRVGDEVIRAVADVLTARIRETDTVARFGGDEFAVLLPGADPESAHLIAGDLIELIGDIRIDAGERQISGSASIGVVVARPSDRYNQDTLIAAADLAMYEAKDAGRRRFSVYDSNKDEWGGASRRFDWSQRIRDALDDDAFVLHYQPIVDLTDGSNGRYEALIRLPDDNGELVLPGTFLYIADRYGLMPAIDRWVTRAVITRLANGELPGGATIAVNISPRSLTDTSLLDHVEQLLVEHQVPASQLIFEVTESAAITQLETAKRFGRGLQRLGCGFALDDFGTGFGSFFHLKHLPYGYIKIDGDFVHGMTTNDNDRLLVEALVNIAKGMNKKTIAEFVGDDETTSLLRRLGVDYGQGYHLGKPVPLDNPGCLTRCGS